MKTDEQLQSVVQAEIPVHTGGASPTDAEIADAVATLLEWSAELNAKSIHTRVENGRVTLEGSVARHSDAQAAVRLASTIRGVASVANRILVDEAASAEAVATQDAWTPLDEEC